MGNHNDAMAILKLYELRRDHKCAGRGNGFLRNLRRKTCWTLSDFSATANVRAQISE